ncbi:acyl-CoA carboxylase subunit epsilon [Glutamicibacter arilaitensis]|uniref:acyl-CoA carboxylase subunit epsilon n=1 Tax=Glutamicibacter arilaitensis TaxID=256701 RepID=UPI003850572D
MHEQSSAIAAATITVTKGQPTAEELAAVTALLTAMGTAAPAANDTPAEPQRVARIRKRRALTPRLGWSLGRH